MTKNPEQQFKKIAQVLSVKPHGNSFVAPCPAHDDKKLSLSVTLKDRNVLLHCYYGCEYDLVESALTALDSDFAFNLNSDSTLRKMFYPGELANLAFYFHDPGMTVEAADMLIKERNISEKIMVKYSLGLERETQRITIPILSENMKIIEIKKYLPKKYRNGKSPRVVSDDKSVHLDDKLYPIQIILDPTQEHIKNLDSHNLCKGLLLVEGEMDALAVISSGFLAITNTCGAKAWDNKFSVLIKRTGLPVIVAMDNDKRGEAGAKKRISSLLTQGIDVFKLIWPNDRPLGHDVTDELLNYGRASLGSLIHNAEPQFNALCTCLK